MPRLSYDAVRPLLHNFARPKGDCTHTMHRYTTAACRVDSVAAHDTTHRHRIRRRPVALGAFSITLFICLLHRVYAIDPPPPPPPVNNPPSIVDFVGSKSQFSWTFEGYVIDENPVGLTVTFGGLLSGHSTTVAGANGHFQYTVEVEGLSAVTAQTTDDHDQDSNNAIYSILVL